MIYLQAPGGRFRVVVINTDEADRIRTGGPLLSPDRSIMLAWTPDSEWLLQRLQTGPGTSGDIARAIDEAARRPEAGTLLGADGAPLPAAEPPAPGPDYSTAVNDLMELWPLDGYELEAYMSATFMPAVVAARRAARGE